MKRRASILAILGCGAAALASAQAPTTTGTQMSARPAAAPVVSGFQAEYVTEVESVGKKLVELAQAMPADKYGWRPSEGVRSVAEVYMHVVSGNSTFPSFLGMPRMEGVSRESEKTVTVKAQVVAMLEKSIENVKGAGAKVPDADLGKKVKTFGGREMTERQVLMLVITHMHEHLGQAIAYARMNGVTPPWSKGE